MALDNRCTGGSFQIDAHIADAAAWEKALEIIRDSSEVDRRIEARRTADPNADRRQHINEELAKIKAKQKRLGDRLEDEDLDDDAYADVKRRLKELANLKKGYESELNIEINVHAEWMQAQEKLKHFHKRCQEMREKLDDPDYEPDYDFKREAIEFFGIIVRVRKAKDGQRIVVESNPPSIVSSIL